MSTTFDLGVLTVETWTLLGRGPVVLGLLWLTLWARGHFGTQKALLALTGFCAGLSLGTWLLPSVIGAVMGGAVAWTAALRIQGESRSTAYPLALYFLGVVSVGRIGCFLNGCCFGLPTETAFAFAYPVDTLAHQTHQLAGWIGEDAGQALAVHPVQLYEAAFLVVLSVALVVFRRWTRDDLATALCVLAAYLAFRGGVDPLRGMVNTESSLTAVGPLTGFQWMMCFAAIFAVAAGVWRARRHVSAGPSVATAVRPGAVWFVCALCVSATHVSLPPLLHALTLGVLSISGLSLMWSAIGAHARGKIPLRAAAVMGGLVLLAPMALHAWDGEPEDAARHWVYGVDADSGRLVRMGDQSTSPERLAARYDELTGGGGGGVDPQRPRWDLAMGGSSLGYRETGCGGDTHIYSHNRLGGSVAYERPADLTAPDLEGHVGQRFELSYTYDSWRHDHEGLDFSEQSQGESHQLTLGYWGLLQYRYAGLGVRLSLGFEAGSGAPDTYDLLSSGGALLPAFNAYLGWPSIALEVGLASPFQPTAVHATWPFLGLRSHGEWGELRMGIASTGVRAPLGSIEAYLSGAFAIRPDLSVGAYLGAGGSEADTLGTTVLLTTRVRP